MRCLPALLLLLAGGAAAMDPALSSRFAATSVTVSPDTVAILKGEVARVTCAPLNKFGALLTNSCNWTSRNPAVVKTTTSTQNASVTALAIGTGYVQAAVSGKSDSVKVVVVDTAQAPLPPDTTSPPPTATVYFRADAESGVVAPPWAVGWGVVSGAGGVKPVTSTAQRKAGARSYLYAVPVQNDNAYSQTLSNAPTKSMGTPGNNFGSGWYSFWAYVDAGYDSPGWNMLLGWMTAVSGAPSPISHVGLEVWGGKLQVAYILKNCSVGLYQCPNISGYTNNGGWYTMTAASPAGVVAFPRGRWVHLSMYYKMAASNGQVIVWQDGVRIMDLTAPTLNTFGGHSIDPLGNKSGGLTLQFGNYGGAKPGPQRLYVDDFLVTDQRVVP